MPDILCPVLRHFVPLGSSKHKKLLKARHSDAATSDGAGEVGNLVAAACFCHQIQIEALAGFFCLQYHCFMLRRRKGAITDWGDSKTKSPRYRLLEYGNLWLSSMRSDDETTSCYHRTYAVCIVRPFVSYEVC